LLVLSDPTFEVGSSKDREARGAASIVEGVGMRDMGLSVRSLTGSADPQEVAPSSQLHKLL
jgi:hypothetical protein